MRRKGTRTRRKRNFATEYERRITRGLAKGLSRSQARGHPKTKEKPISRRGRLTSLTSDQWQQVLKSLRTEKSLTRAAKAAHVSPERFKREAAGKAIAKRKGRWVVRFDLPRRMLLYSDGRAVVVTVGTFEEASLIGRYNAAVRNFLRSNNPKYLEPFVGQSVTDITGASHNFDTNKNSLYRLSHAGEDEFSQIYRLVVV